MEPLSSTRRSSSDDPTLAEIEAGACLPREPGPLSSTSSNPASDSAPAVKALVDRHPPRTASGAAHQSQASVPHETGAHPGFALGVGFNVAMPGAIGAIGAEVGVVVDLGEPKIALFGSDGAGKALVSGLSVGLSAQASLVADVRKFWGAGGELGVNLPDLGVAINLSSPGPGEPLECNGVTVSVGPSIGVDAHYFETKTTGGGVSEIRDAVRRAAGLPGLRRLGP